MCAPLHHRDQEPTTGFEPASTANKTLQSRPAPCSLRATSASSTSARSRTPCGSFGGCLLSQEHTRIKGYPKGVEPLLSGSQPGVQNRYTTDTMCLPRKEWELNPQGSSLDRLPTGSRRQSGGPSVLISSPTRTRTWNTAVEAQHDVRFTIEPYQRKAWELNPHDP